MSSLRETTVQNAFVPRVELYWYSYYWGGPAYPLPSVTNRDLTALDCTAAYMV